ncbi:MAG TPA: cyclase family protein [Xanthobacteraceae bacterium]|jgi:kynurenine formamidase|nr:cyclase family protein [Xanthobacteraceae bacterium]
MKPLMLGTMLATLLLTGSAIAQTPTWLPPADSARCPSKWGAGDERGAANHMKPQTVLNAVKLIKTGEVIELSYPLNAQMPLAAGRVYDMQVKRTAPSDLANKRYGNEELIIAEMGQVGTQFDGFAHQTHNNVHYNCFKTEDIVTRNGFTKLGIEKVGMLMTRGVLIDVAGYKGVPMLGDAYEITAEDLESAIKKQNLTFQPGDAIIIHTGWGKLWNTDPARYGKGNPGIGVKAAEFLIAKDPILLGADTAPVEVNPNPDKLISLPLHQIALVVYGVHLLENLKLDELAAKNVSEFAFVMQPLKLQGATGSTVAPAALR